MLIGIQRKADVDRLLSAVEQSDGQDGFSVLMTGEGTLDHDFNELSQHDLKSGELAVGLPAALIVLLLVFGTVVAGLVPLVMAMIAIIVALGLCALVAEAFTLSVFVVNMLTGMGLALGIDYSLFVVSRYREERVGGRAQHDAIAARRSDGQPRGALQRLGVRDRADRDAARALERDEEPGGRGDRGRDRLGGRGADAATGAARAARRPRQRAADPVRGAARRARRGASGARSSGR